MKKALALLLVCVLSTASAKHHKVTPHKKMKGTGVNPYPILSINGDTTPAQTFITGTAATAYITSNGAGVTTFFLPNSLVSSGTVTSVSVASANGLAGSVATSTTTPAITLSTTVTGLLKGNGTAISAQTTGDITDGTSDGISVGGGTGAVLGSGVTITQQAASASANGYLSSANWSTFNGKQASGNYITALTGDATASGPGSSVMTLATVNSNVGSFSPAAVTVNGKGLVTAASSMSTTGSGDVVLATGPTLTTPNLGTPTTLVATNATGTASGLTAGTVTTNANLTGPITSVGNATSINSQTGTGNTFAMSAGPTFTGTATFSTISASSVTTNIGASKAVVATTSGGNLTAGTTTGTGTTIALSASPTFSGTATFSTISAATITANLSPSRPVSTDASSNLTVGLVESLTGFVSSPADGTYVLDLYAAFPYAINGMAVSTTSGTSTLAVKINGTNVTGLSSAAVSAALNLVTATAANVVNAGDKVTFVLSSSSSPANMAFTMKYTR